MCPALMTKYPKVLEKCTPNTYIWSNAHLFMLGDTVENANTFWAIFSTNVLEYV